MQTINKKTLIWIKGYGAQDHLTKLHYLIILVHDDMPHRNSGWSV